MSADYNKNDLEFRAKYLLKTKIKGKDKINLDILKGNIHEINYLVREGYLVEKEILWVLFIMNLQIKVIALFLYVKI